MNEQNGTDNDLRALVDFRAQIQKQRIAISNRLDALAREADEAQPTTSALWERWFDELKDMESGIDDDIKANTDDYPIIALMTEVKGVGKVLAAQAVAHIDITRASHVSSLWRYAGFGVNADGERDRLQKGVKAPYNKGLKTICWKIATSFMRSNSPYREIYDKAKERYERERPDWTKGHIHNAAVRKMIKIWLQHLWIVWRQLEGLPVTLPYVFDDARHTHYITPEQMGWPVLAAV